MTSFCDVENTSSKWRHNFFVL